MRTKRIKIVEKWVAGWNWQEDLIVVKGRFRVTKKLLIRQDSHNMAPFLDHGSQFSKDDNRLHDTRRAALNWLLRMDNALLTSAYRLVDKANSRIRTITNEVYHETE